MGHALGNEAARERLLRDQHPGLRGRGRHGLPGPEPAVRRGRRDQLRLHRLPGGRRVRGRRPGAARGQRQRRVPVLHRRLEPALPAAVDRRRRGRRPGGAAVRVPVRAAAARRLRRGRAAGHRRAAEPDRDELPAAAERGRGPVPHPGPAARPEHVQRAAARLRVGLHHRRGHPVRVRVRLHPPPHRIPVRPVAAGNAGQRRGGRLARQEPAVDADRDAGDRGSDRRAVGRDPGQLRHDVVAGRMGVRGDSRAVRCGDHWGGGEPVGGWGGGGGRGGGAVLGAVLVPVGFEEVTRYIPTSNNLPPNLIPSLEWVAIGVLIIGFLWFGPQGILPERKRVVSVRAPEPATGEGERARGGPPVTDAPKPAEVVLETVELSREFGGVHAVHEVSFSVRRGTLTEQIGPNGAGKSTLLAMLAGTLPVSSGKVLYQGADVTSLAAFRRARAGLVRTFQLASEYKRLTVMENLVSSVQRNRGDSFLGAMAGPRYWRRDERAAVERASGLLGRFGLLDYANDYAGDLSGGQRRLVEIMRALMAGPRML